MYSFLFHPFSPFNIDFNGTALTFCGEHWMRLYTVNLFLFANKDDTASQTTLDSNRKWQKINVPPRDTSEPLTDDQPSLEYNGLYSEFNFMPEVIDSPEVSLSDVTGSGFNDQSVATDDVDLLQLAMIQSFGYHIGE